MRKHRPSHYKAGGNEYTSRYVCNSIIKQSIIQDFSIAIYFCKCLISFRLLTGITFSYN